MKTLAMTCPKNPCIVLSSSQCFIAKEIKCGHVAGERVTRNESRLNIWHLLGRINLWVTMQQPFTFISSKML